MQICIWKFWVFKCTISYWLVTAVVYSYLFETQSWYSKLFVLLMIEKGSVQSVENMCIMMQETVHYKNKLYFYLCVTIWINFLNLAWNTTDIHYVFFLFLCKCNLIAFEIFYVLIISLVFYIFFLTVYCIKNVRITYICLKY